MSLKTNQQYYRRLFFALLAAGIILRLAVLAVVPMYPDYMRNPRDYLSPGYNDEPLHLQYVRYVSTHWNWPVWQASRDSMNFRTGEYLQPPFYYFVAAPLFSAGHAINETMELYASRLVSIMFGLIAAFFVYKMALDWSGREPVALGAFAAMLLSPNTLLFSTLVSNDGAIMCVGAVAYFLLLRFRFGEDRGWKLPVAVSAVLGLAVWVKLSGFTLIPLALFANHPRDEFLDAWKRRIAVAALAALIAVPVPIWNYFHYKSISPNTWVQIVPESWPEPLNREYRSAVQQPYTSLKTCVRLASMPFEKLWGSVVEKAISLSWAIFWGGMMALGGFLLIQRRKLAWIFVYGFLWSLAGFIAYNLEVFQVEFRLFAPAFPGLALMAATGSDHLKIPIPLQALFWCLPILLIPLYVKYGL